MNSSLSQYFLILNLSKYLNLSHFLSFFLHLKITLFLFFITQKMTRISRSTTNRFNIINNFLIETEDYDIIILSKSGLDDEFIKIVTL